MSTHYYTGSNKTMNTTTTTKQAARAQRTAGRMLQVIIDHAKAQGLQVWTFDSDGEIRQVFITDGNNIATVSRALVGLSVNTVHKPCRECGTGFGLSGLWGETTMDDAIKMLPAAMTMTAPSWATKADRAAVRKWASWEEYMNHRETVLTYYQL